AASCGSKRFQASGDRARHTPPGRRSLLPVIVTTTDWPLAGWSPSLAVTRTFEPTRSGALVETTAVLPDWFSRTILPLTLLQSGALSPATPAGSSPVSAA